MNYDAIIVAGGRGSRLGGQSKPLLVHRGRTLLEHALDAVSGARRIAVVGPAELAPVVSRVAGGAQPDQLLLLTREHPAFAGPAAAVAAGLRSLADGTDDLAGELEDGLSSQEALGRGTADVSPLTVVLASDLLEPGPVVAGVVAAAERGFAEGTAWVPVDPAGRLQPLSCAVETGGLLNAVAQAESGGGLADASMMRLLAMVQIVRLTLEGVDYTDIDTFEDAGTHGIARADTE